MKETAYTIISESLKDELRAIDFYLLAADVAPTPAARLAAHKFAKEPESLGHYHALEKQIEEPLVRRVLHTICQAEEQHKQFLEEQYHRLSFDSEEFSQAWH